MKDLKRLVKILLCVTNLSTSTCLNIENYGKFSKKIHSEKRKRRKKKMERKNENHLNFILFFKLSE